MTNKEKLELTERNIDQGIIFTPNKKQIAMLAQKFTPEIKKYFADEKVQEEFAEWEMLRSLSK